MEGPCLSSSRLLPISASGLVEISRLSDLKGARPYEETGRFLLEYIYNDVRVAVA